PCFALRDRPRRLVPSGVPDLIGDDEGDEPSREQLDRTLEEEGMRGRPPAALVVLGVIPAKLARNIDGMAPSEGEVRRIADHHIEASVREDRGELRLPVERPGALARCGRGAARSLALAVRTGGTIEPV